MIGLLVTVVWSVFVAGPSRSPRAASATLATNHSGHAAGKPAVPG